MRKDTFLIIRGPSDDNGKFYCQSALSHLHNILTKAKALDKQKDQKTAKEKTVFSKKFPEHEMEHLPSLDVSKVKKCIKKVEFYLSYVDSYDMDFE